MAVLEQRNNSVHVGGIVKDKTPIYPTRSSTASPTKLRSSINLHGGLIKGYHRNRASTDTKGTKPLNTSSSSSSPCPHIHSNANRISKYRPRCRWVAQVCNFLPPRFPIRRMSLSRIFLSSAFITYITPTGALCVALPPSPPLTTNARTMVLVLPYRLLLG